MNTVQQLLALVEGKKTYLTAGIAFALLFGQWQKWWVLPEEVYGALLTAALVFIRMGVNKQSPAS